MSILWTIIVGLVVGAIAKLLMPGRDPGGFIITILLGIAGSFLAGWGGRAAGFYQPGEVPGFIMSVLGQSLAHLPDDPEAPHARRTWPA